MSKTDKRPPGKLRLEDCYLFAIASPADLARRLGTSVSNLERLANAEEPYKFWTTKAGRDVEEPQPDLQRLHARIHRYLARVQVPDYLHSPVKHRSYVTNAQAHATNQPTVKIDIRKFFQSVPRRAINRFFKEDMSCAGDVAALLGKLLSYKDHLPTGSSASPIIAYYAFRAMFHEIAELARAQDLVMTCYVDDITVTGSADQGQTVRDLQKIIGGFGLRSHKVKMFAAGSPKIITGVVVDGLAIKLPNKRHKAIADGFEEISQATTSEDELNALNRLVSRLHEAGMIEPSFKARARLMERRRAAVRKTAQSRPMSNLTDTGRSV